MLDILFMTFFVFASKLIKRKVFLFLLSLSFIKFKSILNDVSQFIIQILEYRILFILFYMSIFIYTHIYIYIYFFF